jgi:hypothetical protein
MAHRIDELRHLRERMERCYRLAREVADPTIAAKLNAMARQAEIEIAALEDGRAG